MVVVEVCSTMKYPKRSQYKHAKQKKYHVRNWAEYNEGLRRRGDLTVWFDEEAIANWKADKTGKPGGQRVYSDMAIETSLVVRMVYKLAYRQTEGFLHSMASRLGLGIEIPDYSTLCRRSRLLRKKLRIPKAASSQAIHLMIDSTGLRIHVGTARKPPNQRAWRKLHIAVDRKTGNIVASELTGVTRSRRNASPRFANTDSSTSSIGGRGQCLRQGSGLRSHRSAQSWTKDARGDSAATKRDAQSAVAPDGTTVGALTDFVLTFKDINPDKKGERLHPGATIEVVLSDAFTNTGAGGNTAAILQGWPQSPPAPPPLFPWTIDVDGNTITLTLTDDFKPGENGPHPGQSRFI